MRKIWLRFLGPAVLAAALLAGCSGGGETENVENAAADGVLTVGILAGEDIFSYTDEAGQLRGVEPQLMERLGESLGVSVEFDEAGSLDELLNWLDLGQADIALGRIAQRDEYNQKYQVSRNYAKKGIYLLTRKNDYTDTLAGLAETREDVIPGQQASVYIKSILPARMKVKLVIIDTFDYHYRPAPPKYFYEGEHIDRFVYSPEGSEKEVITDFTLQPHEALS